MHFKENTTIRMKNFEDYRMTDANNRDKRSSDANSPPLSDADSTTEDSIRRNGSRRGSHERHISSNNFDSPLDFSMKRETTSILARELNNYRNAQLKQQLETRPPVTVSPELGQTAVPPPTSGNNGAPPKDSNSNGVKHEAKIGEPQTAMPGLLPGTTIPHTGSIGTLPGFAPGMVVNGMIGAMPMMVDPSRASMPVTSTTATNGKNTRPFKAYPKDPLSLPLGYFGLPGMSPFPGLDLQAAQAMSANSEEMFKQYRDYVIKLQEHQQLTGGGNCEPVNKENKPEGVIDSSGNKVSPPPLVMPATLPKLPSNPEFPPMSTPERRLSDPGFKTERRLSDTGSLPDVKSPTSSETSLASMSPSSTPTMPTPSPVISRAVVSSTVQPSPITNSSRKRSRNNMPDEKDNTSYWERRRKNNEAAKRSRDARRAKEDEIAIRAAFLEQENLKLRVEVASLKTETAKLRCMLYNS